MNKREALAQEILAIMKDGAAGTEFTVKWLRSVVQRSRDPVYDALLLLEKQGRVQRNSTKQWHLNAENPERPSVATLLERARQPGPVIDVESQ